MRRVRQGCPLSPTLFSLFIEDMDNIWERKNEGRTVMRGEKIFALKFADDIVLVADEEDGLRSMLASLERYVRDNKLTVNITKTEVLIFKRGADIREMKNGSIMGKSWRWLRSINTWAYGFRRGILLKSTLGYCQKN